MHLGLKFMDQLGLFLLAVLVGLEFEPVCSALLPQPLLLYAIHTLLV